MFSDRIEKFNKGFLIISFIFGCIVSHYSSAYIIFVVFLLTFILTYLFSVQYKITRNLYFYFIIIFFCALFIWYSLIIEGPFSQAVQFIGQIYSTSSSGYAPALSQLTGKNLSLPVISATNLIIKLLTFSLIGYGVFAGLISWLIQNQKISKNTIKSSIKNLDLEFIIIGLISGFILFLTVLLPFISVGYDIERIYLLITVILASYFVIGGISISEKLNFISGKILKNKSTTLLKILSPATIISIIVITNFLFSMSVPHQLSGDTSSVFFNSNGDLYDRMFIHDQDVSGATWLKEYREKDIEIYSDVYSEKVLQSHAEILETSRIPIIDSVNIFGTGYLFTIYYNNINMKIINDWEFKKPNLEPLHDVMVKDLNKIYTNNASEIWNIEE